MKVNELRVDNWVEITSDEGNEFIQCNVNTIKLVERGSDFIIPIPLTEEWLLKFGIIRWVKNGIVSDLFYDGLFQFQILNNDKLWIIYSFDETNGKVWHLCDIQYVHQLQNLYYVLTGEELQSK